MNRRKVEALKVLLRPAFLNYVLAALSGLLLALPFLLPPLSILVWIGFMPLLYVLRNTNHKSVLLTGIVFGFTFFSIVLYWIRIFGFLAWFALSIYLSIWVVLFAAGAWWIMKTYRGAAQFILIPSLWTLCEHGRALGPWGFGWAQVGSAVENISLLAIASYVGELGLGFAIVLVNLIVLYTAETIALRRKPNALFKGALILLIITLVFSATNSSSEQASRSIKMLAKSIKVAVIQPNLPKSLEASKFNGRFIEDRYFSMTIQALMKKPDLIIWPENIFMAYRYDESEFLERLRKFTNWSNTPLIFGRLEREDRNIYNSAFYVDESGKTHVYRKIRPVPFGEFVPMRGLVERLNSMAKLVSDIKPGRDFKVFDIRHGSKFSTIICFESSDSMLVGKMIRRGARMIIVLTNDSWFGETAAAEQHFRITRMRAIEYGVPVIQAASTGISGIINQYGEVINRTKINEQGILYGKVEFAHKPSFFARFGYLMPYLYLAFIFTAILFRFLSRRPTLS
ncbi:MAG: apolipoprotein N-acyltransferase [Actinomycetota bacterium]